MKYNAKNRLKIGVPSKGRLSEPILALLKRAGLKFRRGNRALYAECKKNPITLVFVRSDDIPLLVAEEAIDLGITGSDLIIEAKAKVKELLPLGFGTCRLSVATPKNKKIRDLKKLNGKSIATSFPNITKKFFKSQGINVKTFEVSGSVEVMINLGLADAIVDLVETGDTLRENGLEVIADIGSYGTTLIANKSIAENEYVQWLTKRIEGVIIADKYSILEYNISRKNLSKAEKIAPGFESPTIAALEDKNWCAVKVMVNTSDVHEIMDELKTNGATAIMQTKINNCRL